MREEELWEVCAKLKISICCYTEESDQLTIVGPTVDKIHVWSLTLVEYNRVANTFSSVGLFICRIITHIASTIFFSCICKCGGQELIL